MLKGKTVAVVVPAYNEEKQIEEVLETIPDFVDRVVVVDDVSVDNTVNIVKKYIKNSKKHTNGLKRKENIEENKYSRAEIVLNGLEEKEKDYYAPQEIYSKNGKDSRIVLIQHSENSGVGASIASGYRWCKDHNIECTAVMAGDGQMDPNELENICMPVVEEGIDYAKANRLKHRSAFFVIPKVRFFGNSILSLFTKIASGYWRVSDTQTGFTAISLPALRAIRIYKIYPRYGCPNDILVKLNIAFCTLKEVESKPVYDIGEESSMNEFLVVPKISWLLFKSFWKRLYVKYLFRDFHPLFILYNFGFISILGALPFGVQIARAVPLGANLQWQFFAIFAILLVLGIQFITLAMWMDMMDNERLYK
ncbi:glycosyltransferase family 2 protein [Patescibacteria group bacterium]